MPKWIDDRKKHILKNNPDMGESQAWAIATQQAYAAGKAPKHYGTKKWRKKAKKKYDTKMNKKNKTASVIDTLIVLANKLDSVGSSKEADQIDSLVDTLAGKS